MLKREEELKREGARQMLTPPHSTHPRAEKVGPDVTFLVTLGQNTIKTKKGWVWAGGIAALFGVMQTYYIGSAIMQKRRRIKALEDVKKM